MLLRAALTEHEVLEEIKRDPASAAVPVIVITAWGEETTAGIARGRGAADVVAKPFEVADLQARVNAALSG